jgi:DNA-directed RNA polymerase subunit RPC12/RpoP
MAELYKSRAPEVELYFSAENVRNMLKKTLEELDHLAKAETEKDAEHHRKRIRHLLMDCDRALEYPMGKMGRPVKCPRCGKDSLKEIYGMITCPECGYKKEF